MEYRPRWERILLLAAILNFAVILIILSNQTPSQVKSESENLREIAWVDVPESESVVQPQPEVQTFSEIKFPSIEIPKTERCSRKKC